jgi:trehalose utilization protein
MSTPLRVTVWGENVHEKKLPLVAKLYPKGMHETIAEGLRELGGVEVRTATLDQPEHGLTDAVLEATDVLTWWGHCAHGQVEDKIVDRVQKRVLEGMGLIVLHSGHYAKIFKRLLGTTCSLTWREAGEKERLWVCNPGHPIAIPTPDELVFISWFQGGEVFRSGATWKRGNGKIFYFRPGHETYPTYHQKEVRRVIHNSVFWARPEGARWVDTCPNVPIDKAAEKFSAQGESLHKAGEAGYR